MPTIKWGRNIRVIANKVLVTERLQHLLNIIDFFKRQINQNMRGHGVSTWFIADKRWNNRLVKVKPVDTQTNIGRCKKA